MVAVKTPSSQSAPTVVSPAAIEHFDKVAKALNQLAANLIDVLRNNMAASSLESLRDEVTQYVLISRRIGELSKLAIPTGTKVSHPSLGDGVVLELAPDFQPCSVRIQFEKYAEYYLVPLYEIAINDRYLDTNYIPF